MSNYSATVVQIDNLRKHSNADRLMCTNIFGNNVIVGKDTKEGDVGLFFPLESQLGEEFAKANDLVRRKDENGKTAGGMFDDNRRVRAQTFRGEKSMGFFVPIEYLYKLLPEGSLFEVPAFGEELETWNGYDISKKYLVPTRQTQGSKSQQGKKAKKESKVIPGQFAFHFDTAQLGKNVHKLQPESLISITWKFHGTSGIASHVLCNKKLTWYEKVLKKLGVNVVDSDYDYLFSSRKVIKNEDREYSHFYDADIWSIVGEQFRGKLHKGETAYFEIVGFLPNGQHIQKNYDYGCGPTEHKVYIYRITQTNVDGVVIELPWHQVKHRAIELGFETVPEIYYGKSEWFCSAPLEGKYGQFFLEMLQKWYVHDQDCQFCNNSVPSEGVVVRVENGDGIENLKLKSFRFYGYESKQLDKGEADMESEEA